MRSLLLRSANHFRRTRLALLVLLAGSLSGCGNNDAEVMFTDYQQRWAAFLNMPSPTQKMPDNIAAFPDRKARLFELPETREGLRNIYALRECRITNLIAKHNSSLGRVALPSQQWLYELALWRQLKTCWQSDIPQQLSKNDRDRLENLLALKTRQLPKASWNALFGSNEWIDNFSRASSPFSPQQSITLEQSLAALEYLRQATRNQFNLDWQAQSSVLEQHLQVLTREPLSAELLRSLLLATQRLDEINRLLEQHRTDSKRCPDSSIKTFLSEHEATNYLATLDHVGSRWLSAIERLLNAYQVSKPSVSRYRQAWLSLNNPEAPWQRFQTSRKHFATHWRQLMKRCENLEN